MSEDSFWKFFVNLYTRGILFEADSWPLLLTNTVTAVFGAASAIVVLVPALAAMVATVIFAVSYVEASVPRLPVLVLLEAVSLRIASIVPLANRCADIVWRLSVLSFLVTIPRRLEQPPRTVALPQHRWSLRYRAGRHWRHWRFYFRNTLLSLRQLVIALVAVTFALRFALMAFPEVATRLRAAFCAALVMFGIDPETHVRALSGMMFKGFVEIHIESALSQSLRFMWSSEAYPFVIDHALSSAFVILFLGRGALVIVLWALNLVFVRCRRCLRPRPHAHTHEFEAARVHVGSEIEAKAAYKAD
jgi:hypothetical protein